jgi:hypothetical protein
MIKLSIVLDKLSVLFLGNVANDFLAHLSETERNICWSLSSGIYLFMLKQITTYSSHEFTSRQLLKQTKFREFNSSHFAEQKKLKKVTYRRYLSKDWQPENHESTMTIKETDLYAHKHEQYEY